MYFYLLISQGPFRNIKIKKCLPKGTKVLSCQSCWQSPWTRVFTRWQLKAVKLNHLSPWVTELSGFLVLGLLVLMTLKALLLHGGRVVLVRACETRGHPHFIGCPLTLYLWGIIIVCVASCVGFVIEKSVYLRLDCPYSVWGLSNRLTRL